MEDPQEVIPKMNRFFNILIVYSTTEFDIVTCQSKLYFFYLLMNWMIMSYGK